MKKRDLIEALKPLADDTEIVIDNAVTGTQIEYIDDRFRGPLISENQVRLYGHRATGRENSTRNSTRRRSSASIRCGRRKNDGRHGQDR